MQILFSQADYKRQTVPSIFFSARLLQFHLAAGNPMNTFQDIHIKYLQLPNLLSCTPASILYLKQLKLLHQELRKDSRRIKIA